MFCYLFRLLYKRHLVREVVTASQWSALGEADTATAALHQVAYSNFLLAINSMLPNFSATVFSNSILYLREQLLY